MRKRNNGLTSYGTVFLNCCTIHIGRPDSQKIELEEQEHENYLLSILPKKLRQAYKIATQNENRLNFLKHI